MKSLVEEITDLKNENDAIKNLMVQMQEKIDALKTELEEVKRKMTGM